MRTLNKVLAIVALLVFQSGLQAASASAWNELYKQTDELLKEEAGNLTVIADNIKKLRANAAKLGGKTYLNKVSRLAASLDIRTLLDKGDIKQAEKSLKMYKTQKDIKPVVDQLQKKIQKAKVEQAKPELVEEEIEPVPKKVGFAPKVTIISEEVEPETEGMQASLLSEDELEARWEAFEKQNPAKAAAIHKRIDQIFNLFPNRVLSQEQQDEMAFKIMQLMVINRDQEIDAIASKVREYINSLIKAEWNFGSATPGETQSSSLSSPSASAVSIELQNQLEELYKTAQASKEQLLRIKENINSAESLQILNKYLGRVDSIQGIVKAKRKELDDLIGKFAGDSKTKELSDPIKNLNAEIESLIKENRAAINDRVKFFLPSSLPPVLPEEEPSASSSPSAPASGAQQAEVDAKKLVEKVIEQAQNSMWTIGHMLEPLKQMSRSGVYYLQTLVEKKNELLNTSKKFNDQVKEAHGLLEKSTLTNKEVYKGQLDEFSSNVNNYVEEINELLYQGFMFYLKKEQEQFGLWLKVLNRLFQEVTDSKEIGKLQGFTERIGQLNKDSLGELVKFEQEAKDLADHINDISPNNESAQSLLSQIDTEHKAILALKRKIEEAIKAKKIELEKPAAAPSAPVAPAPAPIVPSAPSAPVANPQVQPQIPAVVPAPAPAAVAVAPAPVPVEAPAVPAQKTIDQLQQELVNLKSRLDKARISHKALETNKQKSQKQIEELRVLGEKIGAMEDEEQKLIEQIKKLSVIQVTGVIDNGGQKAILALNSGNDRYTLRYLDKQGNTTQGLWTYLNLNSGKTGFFISNDIPEKKAKGNQFTITFFPLTEEKYNEYKTQFSGF